MSTSIPIAAVTQTRHYIEAIKRCFGITLVDGKAICRLELITPERIRQLRHELDDAMDRTSERVTAWHAVTVQFCKPPLSDSAMTSIC